MEYNEDMIFTYKCESCSTINRVINPKKSGGRWKCGKCGSVILHRKRIFHEALIIDVRRQLMMTHEKLKEIRFPTFAQKKINEIEKLNQKYRSKMENWLDHLSYLKNEEEKQEIVDSYKPDINEIERLTISISEEIKDSRWLKEKIQGLDVIRKVMLSTGLMMKAIAGVLAFFGLDEFSKLITGMFNFNALEHLSASIEDLSEEITS